jgi:transcriptional repressor NrdR
MKCQFCGHLKTKVVDSRPGNDNNHIRRRRYCPECDGRFTTFERQEENLPQVIKRDGRVEPFDKRKMLASVKQSCTKLPVGDDHITRMVRRIEGRIRKSRLRRLRSEVLGDWVANGLLELHPAAFIRYSMVHREIQDHQSLQRLLEEEFG